jgi:hypothetical protein
MLGELKNRKCTVFNPATGKRLRKLRFIQADNLYKTVTHP